MRRMGLVLVMALVVGGTTMGAGAIGYEWADGTVATTTHLKTWPDNYSRLFVHDSSGSELLEVDFYGGAPNVHASGATFTPDNVLYVNTILGDIYRVDDAAGSLTKVYNASSATDYANGPMNYNAYDGKFYATGVKYDTDGSGDRVWSDERLYSLDPANPTAGWQIVAGFTSASGTKPLNWFGPETQWGDRLKSMETARGLQGQPTGVAYDDKVYVRSSNGIIQFDVSDGSSSILVSEDALTGSNNDLLYTGQSSEVAGTDGPLAAVEFYGIDPQTGDPMLIIPGSGNGTPDSTEFKAMGLINGTTGSFAPIAGLLEDETADTFGQGNKQRAMAVTGPVNQPDSSKIFFQSGFRKVLGNIVRAPDPDASEGAWTEAPGSSGFDSADYITDVVFTDDGDTGEFNIDVSPEGNWDVHIIGLAVAGADKFENWHLVGDANLDKQVNLSDLIALGQNYGDPGDWGAGDFTGDGMVNLSDLIALGQNYNSEWGGMPDTEVNPEPGTVALLGLGGLALLRRRRNA